MRRGWTTTVAVLVLCGAITACGGGGTSTPTSPATPTTPTTPTTTASDGTILLEGLPLDLASVDYAFVYSRRQGRESDWRPLDDFGRMFPATESRPVSQPNPQPTFYAPLGTPVLAVVTGVVTSIPTLYSNDFSIMIASSGQGGTWEHEHVMNVRVRVGDRVTAGQPIADVSNYECAWGRNGSATDPLCQSGLGLVELGLLYGGSGPPQHRCPFDPAVVAPARQSTIFGLLDSARARIKTAFGNAGLFGESSWATPQCIIMSRVDG